MQTNSTMNTSRTNTPRLSVSSINSLTIRHKEDTLIVNNLEFVMSDNLKEVEQRERKRGKYLVLRLLTINDEVY